MLSSYLVSIIDGKYIVYNLLAIASYYNFWLAWAQKVEYAAIN